MGKDIRCLAMRKCPNISNRTILIGFEHHEGLLELDRQHRKSRIHRTYQETISLALEMCLNPFMYTKSQLRGAG